MNIQINSVADLPVDKLEELEKREKIDSITILGDFKTTVSVSEYKAIYQKLAELTNGIDPNWSQTKKFVLIYKRISENIEYDYIAGYPEKGNPEQEAYSIRERENCRNLKNGLLVGKCVCAGYAEILRNGCLLKGVPALYIAGFTSNTELHAWNQVEIDNGTWIEVDPTWDHKHGTKYIGTDKQKFLEEHGRYYDVGKSDVRGNDDFMELVNSNEHIVSNFDLTSFINEEFGLDFTEYSIEEQNQFLNLLEKRDVQGLDVSQELKILVARIHQKQKAILEFEEECGTTIEELRNLGFSEIEISNMQNKYDTQTGEKLNRKEIVFQRKTIKLKFEEECGITIKELKELGFTEIEILKMQANYNTQTGAKLDRKTIVREACYNKKFENECGITIKELEKLGFTEEEISQMQDNYDAQTGVKLNRKEIVRNKVIEKSKNTTFLKKEDKEKLKSECRELHPNVASVLIREIETGNLSLEDAMTIIQYRQGNVGPEEVTSVLSRRRINMIINGDKSITFQKIGQETTNAFTPNIEEAIEAIETLENGVKLQEKTKEDQTQGEK